MRWVCHAGLISGNSLGNQWDYYLFALIFNESRFFASLVFTLYSEILLGFRTQPLKGY